MSEGGDGPDWGIPGVRIVDEIGRGSFGRVFRATEPDNGRLVAVKVLQTAALDERELRRFDRERRAAGALSSHPNIVTVHRSGLDAAGRPYLVMELAAGRSLADRLANEGALGAVEVADIGVKLAGAVESAHRVEVVHCDIKPENVLVSSSGEPLLADFGIAQVARGGSTSLGRAGTFAYSAPEIFKGDAPSPASDVFALGATLYALATGFSPFMADRSSSQESVMYRIVHEDPPDPRAHGVPDALATVLERALEKDPARRHGSAAELGAALQAAQEALGAPPTRLVVQDITVPEATGSLNPAEGATAALPRLGSAASSDRTARPARWYRLAAAAVVLVVAVVGAVLVAGAVGGGDGGEAPDGGELGEEAAAKVTTTTTAPTTTTAAPVLAALAHRSVPAEFLGTRVERQWTVPAGQNELIVELTLTNVSGTRFRWHHDEALPTSLVAAATIPQGHDPAPEAITDAAFPILRYWHDLAPGDALTVAFSVPRQASWPRALAQADLERWDREQQPLLQARRSEILHVNGLPGVNALPPGAAPATTAPPTTTTAPPVQPAAPAPQRQPTATTAAPAAPAPSAVIVGPSTITAGDRAEFSVQSSNAVSGTWSETCVAPSRPAWAPGDGYVGVWTVPGQCTLSLTVANATGQTATASKPFTVQAFSAEIIGPRVINFGVPAEWSTRSSGAVSGRWEESCVGASQPNWSPGDGFVGTWFVRGTCRLSLTVFSAGGQSFTTSLDFQVV